MESKEKLREKYFEKRQSLSNEYIKKKSQVITHKLDEYIEEKNYKDIMIFVSFRNEVNTHGIIKKWLKDNEKNVYVPYIDKKLDEMKISKINDFENDLTPGVFDILEPREELKGSSSRKDLDLIVVPGLIFSKQGYRIGYGGGYYDMFLSKIKSRVDRIGIVCSEFIVDELPVDSYDLPVDLIITEQESIKAEG